jgi:hypothetical protein
LKKYDKIISRTAFDSLINKNQIFKKFIHGFCYTDMCKICEDGHKIENSLSLLLKKQNKTREDNIRTEEFSKCLAVINYHKNQKDSAKQTFKEEFENLRIGEALLVIDFKGKIFILFYFLFLEFV